MSELLREIATRLDASADKLRSEVADELQRAAARSPHDRCALLLANSLAVLGME